MRVYGYCLSVCSAFLLLISSSRILSTEAVLFLEESLSGDTVHLKSIHGSVLLWSLWLWLQVPVADVSEGCRQIFKPVKIVI